MEELITKIQKKIEYLTTLNEKNDMIIGQLIGLKWILEEIQAENELKVEYSKKRK